MSTFSKNCIIEASPSLIPHMAMRLQESFQKDGYEVDSVALSSGGFDISITKGNIFKAVLGMKTALKIVLLPHENSISFEAGVGILGQQVIPTIISMLFFWPVLVTQIWGLIQQSQLDDKALDIVSQVAIEGHVAVPEIAEVSSCIFCTDCGTKNDPSASFCVYCGHRL